MRTFSTSIDIPAPAARVWDVIRDVERWQEWTPSITSVRLLGRGPFEVGLRALIRQPKLPPAMWKVTELDAGRGFTWKSGLPGMWVYAHHSVVPIDGGGRATLSLRFDGVLGELLGRLTRSINDRYLGLEAAGLKRRSEEVLRSGRR